MSRKQPVGRPPRVAGETTCAKGVRLCESELAMLQELREHLGAPSDAEAMRRALTLAHQVLVPREPRQRPQPIRCLKPMEPKHPQPTSDKICYVK